MKLDARWDFPFVSVMVLPAYGVVSYLITSRITTAERKD